MMENIFIAIFAVLVFGGAVAAWWIENGPEKKGKDDKKKDNQGDNTMIIYLLIAVISVGLWFAFVGIAKLIDLSNKNKDWYKELNAKIESEK